MIHNYHYHHNHNDRNCIIIIVSTSLALRPLPKPRASQSHCHHQIRTQHCDTPHHQYFFLIVVSILMIITTKYHCHDHLPSSWSCAESVCMSPSSSLILMVCHGYQHDRYSVAEFVSHGARMRRHRLLLTKLLLMRSYHDMTEFVF